MVGGGLIDRFMYGIQTEGWRRLRPKELENARFSDCIEYQACPYRGIRLALRILRPKDALRSKDAVLYDLGCGKGRVICAFAASGLFKKCVGIELSEELAERARQNVARMRRKPCPIEVITQDAAVSDLSNGDVFFFFNPFGLVTMKAVLDRIPRNRKVAIVCIPEYSWPLLDAQPWLRRVGCSWRVGVWESA
jgi:SAM-dependent methyltransferase